MLRETSNPKNRVPLEREYEGWIAYEIQEYFAARGAPVQVFAFSPKAEKDYPADEIVSLPRGNMCFALQVKRPLPAAKVDDHVTWKISPTQHSVLKACKGIFYALPTFRNRDDWKTCAHHLLIAHPGWTSLYLGEPVIQTKTTLTLRQGASEWKASSVEGDSQRSLRWGAFIEWVERGDVGLTPQDLRDEIKASVKNVTQHLDVDDSDSEFRLIVVSVAKKAVPRKPRITKSS